MAKLKMFGNSDSLKGTPPPKLFNVRLQLPRRELDCFCSVLVPTVKRDGVKVSDFQKNVTMAVEQLIADIETAGDNLHVDYGIVTFQGYQKITENPGTVRVKHNNEPTRQPGIKVVTRVDRKFLRGLPEIKNHTPYYEENYSPTEEITDLRVSISSRFLEQLKPISDKFHILPGDLVSQAMNRCYVRRFYSQDKPTKSERLPELDQDDNKYNPHFEQPDV